MHPILTMAGLTFREAVRRRIVLAALLLGLAFLAIYNLGFYFLRADVAASGGLPAGSLMRSEFFNFIFMAGMYAVNFLSLVMAALIIADTLSGEINSGTIQAVVTKPVRRAEIVLGKWLGYVSLLSLYLLLMAGGVALTLWWQTGYRATQMPAGMALVYLNALLIMTITLACSSTFSTLATGGIVFGLYSLAFIGGWIEQFGTYTQNQTAINIGIISSLIMPSEAVWKRAAYEMTSPVLRGFGFSPFVSNSVPSTAMIVYAVLFLLAALAFAILQFRRRDL